MSFKFNKNFWKSKGFSLGKRGELQLEKDGSEYRFAVLVPIGVDPETNAFFPIRDDFGFGSLTCLKKDPENEGYFNLSVFEPMPVAKPDAGFFLAGDENYVDCILDAL